MKKYQQLEKELSIQFNDAGWLKRAFVHRSYLNEHPKTKLKSNERLEFLGDAVVELWVSRFIFDRFPDYPEGNLTNLRARVVCTESLAKVARQLKLYRFLLLSRGEQKESGGKSDSLMADTFEALVGAIYQDQGLEVCGRFLQKYILPQIQEMAQKPTLKDYKSLLQEKIQKERKQTPYYQLTKTSGPDHAKRFTFTVKAGKENLAVGQGKSKQEAQQEAAKKALEKVSPKS